MGVPSCSMLLPRPVKGVPFVAGEAPGAPVMPLSPGEPWAAVPTCTQGQASEVTISQCLPLQIACVWCSTAIWYAWHGGEGERVHPGRALGSSRAVARLVARLPARAAPGSLPEAAHGAGLLAEGDLRHRAARARVAEAALCAAQVLLCMAYIGQGQRNTSLGASLPPAPTTVDCRIECAKRACQALRPPPR